MLQPAAAAAAAAMLDQRPEDGPEDDLTMLCETENVGVWVWGRGINLVRTPHLSSTGHLQRCPDSLKSSLHFVIWTNFLAVLGNVTWARVRRGTLGDESRLEAPALTPGVNGITRHYL